MLFTVKRVATCLQRTRILSILTQHTGRNTLRRVSFAARLHVVFVSDQASGHACAPTEVLSNPRGRPRRRWHLPHHRPFGPSSTAGQYRFFALKSCAPPGAPVPVFLASRQRCFEEPGSLRGGSAAPWLKGGDPTMGPTSHFGGWAVEAPHSMLDPRVHLIFTITTSTVTIIIITTATPP